MQIPREFDEAREREKAQKESQVNISLTYHLFIYCPYCHEQHDLIDHDDGEYTRLLFNNKWEDTSGEKFECPSCDKEFELGIIEY